MFFLLQINSVGQAVPLHAATLISMITKMVSFFYARFAKFFWKNLPFNYMEEETKDFEK